MTNIYIFGVSYTNSTPLHLSPTGRNLSETLNAYKGGSQLEVRTGYFGMCVRQRGVVWLCSSDANGLAVQIGPENDPLDLIGVAAKFKDDVIFSGLLFMAVVLAFISIILLTTFPGWHEERDERTGSMVDVRPFPSRPVSQVALTCSFVASVLLLMSSLWQHVGSVGAAAMAETVYQGNVHAAIGTQAVSMAWAGFTLVTIATIGLLVMILSIIVLDRLTDND
jgi:competence protein ComGC